MSHEITTNADGSVEAFFAVEKAWHGLGDFGEENVSVKEARERSNTGWTVSTRKGYMKLPNGEFVEIPNFRAIARNDNNFVLGNATEKYQQVQTEEVDDTIEEVFPNPKPCNAAFSLKGGAKVIRVMEFSDWNVKLSGKEDRHATYLTAIIGHDGVTGISFLPTDTRVVCANTLRMAISASGKGNKRGKVGKDGITIRHSAKYAERLEAAKHALNVARKMEEIHAENMWALSSKSVTLEQMRNILGICVDEFLPKPEENVVEDILGINAKLKNTDLRMERREEMRQGFNLWTAWETAQFGNCAPSGEINSYLLFNAISDFCEHKGTYRGSGTERAENEFVSRMSGKADDMKQFALATVATASGIGSLFGV